MAGIASIEPIPNKNPRRDMIGERELITIAMYFSGFVNI
jgi:hypothetical protein